MTRRLDADVVAVGLSIAGIAVGIGLVAKALADITHGVALPAVKR